MSGHNWTNWDRGWPSERLTGQLNWKCSRCARTAATLHGDVPRADMAFMTRDGFMAGCGELVALDVMES